MLPSVCRSSPHVCGVLTPGEQFALGELVAMSRDGLLRPVYGQVFLPTALQETSEHRALAMSLHFPSSLRQHLVLARFSAAWVYTGQSRPPQISAFLDKRRRSGTLPPFSTVHIHERRLRADEVHHIGQVRITTPVRTAVDLMMIQATPAEWPKPEATLLALIAYIRSIAQYGQLHSAFAHLLESHSTLAQRQLTLRRTRLLLGARQHPALAVTPVFSSRPSHGRRRKLRQSVAQHSKYG